MDPLTDRDPAACPPLAPLSARIAWAAAFERRIVAREHDLVAAVRTDIHKADWETVTQDILPLVASIRWHRDHAARVLGPRKLGGAPWWMLGQRHWAQRLPLGRVLVIATWNYPLQLLGIQLTQSVVAGNRTVVKPSERAPRSQRMLVELAREALADAGLPADMVRAADATREAGRELLERERFDHVVFTGSTAVGREIAALCARTLTPTTLELSGRDSAIVLADADPALAARWWTAPCTPASWTPCARSLPPRAPCAWPTPRWPTAARRSPAPPSRRAAAAWAGRSNPPTTARCARSPSRAARAPPGCSRVTTSGRRSRWCRSTASTTRSPPTVPLASTSRRPSTAATPTACSPMPRSSRRSARTSSP